jgi:hypothetical protein
MDRDTLVKHLVDAERHVAEGERHLEYQRCLIQRLERDGLDSHRARAVLTTFEDLQRLHLVDLERTRELLTNLTG